VTRPQEAGEAQERVYPRSKALLDVASLTPVQRQALQVVLDNPAVWAIPSNLFELYGLPASPAAVRQQME
jgi:hypothetical protein